MGEMTYEEQFGPVQRRVLRVWRTLFWHVKGLLGMQRAILVELRWRLGDEIMALPVYEALQNRYPNDRVVVWCNYPELLENTSFYKDANEKKVFPDRYLLLRSGPRTTYRLEHYARCAAISTPTTQPKLHYAHWDTPELARIPDGEGPLVAVCSGASWPIKRWPVTRWEALCHALEERGCRIVELGHGADARIGVGTSLAGETSVASVARVLHAADVLVCCDSGLMHLALAAETPAVALFGPTDPAILVRGVPNLTIVSVDRDCQGCWNESENDRVPGTCPQGETDCLALIAVETVLAQVLSALGR